MRKREPDVASSQDRLQMASLRIMVKPIFWKKKIGNVFRDLPGLEGDGAQRKFNQELGRPFRSKPEERGCVHWNECRLRN